MQLKVSVQIENKVSNGELSGEEASRFSSFVDTCNSEFMTHPVITDNKFCKWFASGAADREIVRHFIIQFSVFSNLFLLAQLQKMINAGSLEGMRASKEILANELGVIFHKPGSKAKEVADKDQEGDPEIVSIEGSVDGGTFRFRAAHFEWLLKMGEVIDIGFNDMGKRRNGTPATLFFCDELSSIYGNEDPNIAEGASFAVENWAAAGWPSSTRPGNPRSTAMWPSRCCRGTALGTRLILPASIARPRPPPRWITATSFGRTTWTTMGRRMRHQLCFQW